jgi:hypothetical protein
MSSSACSSIAATLSSLPSSAATAADSWSRASASSSEFRAGLEERELGYVVQVKGGTSAYAEGVRRERADYAGVGPRPQPR